jgi:hypothetical protein
VFVLLSSAVVAGAIVWAATRMTREIRRSHAETARTRSLQLVAVFAPGMAAAAADPRALLTWQPLAAAARRMFPESFQLLDESSGGRFPFSVEQIQAAHSQWTADWLAWEQTHDGEFKLKAATARAELAASGGEPLARARLDGVEREKLERYQKRYAEYVHVAKALQALVQ